MKAESKEERLHPGELIAERYRVVSNIGEGGSAQAYRTLDELWGTTRCVKLLREAEGPDLAVLANEFSLLCALRHPRLLRVEDFGILDATGGPRAYYTSTLIEGRDLLDTAGGGTTFPAILPALTDVLDALSYLHSAGLRHGDVKGQNVLVDEMGRATLIDLGCARSLGQRRPLALWGTLDHMAPELLDPRADVDRRADLYAFGIMLGQVGTRLRRGLPEPVGNLVERLVAEHPDDRPGSAEEVLEALGTRGRSLLHPSAAAPLLGRDSELEAFEEAHSLFLRGERGPRVWHLKGPTGSGKTRMLRELRWRCQLRSRVLEGVTTKSEGSDRPLTKLFGRALGRTLDDNLEALLEAAQELSSAKRKTVLLLDDVQRLNSEEKRRLKAIERVIGDKGALCLLSGRTLTRGERSEAVSETRQESNTLEWELSALGLSDLTRWVSVTSAERDPSTLLQKTDGWPARVAAELSGMAPPRESALDLSLAYRRLPPGQRKALGLLAMLRDPIDPILAHSLIGESGLRQLCELNWLEYEGKTPRLLRGSKGALRSILKRDRRTKLYRTIAKEAQALYEAQTSEQDKSEHRLLLGRLSAEHWARGGKGSRALHLAQKVWDEDKSKGFRAWRRAASAFVQSRDDALKLWGARAMAEGGKTKRALQALERFGARIDESGATILDKDRTFPEEVNLERAKLLLRLERLPEALTLLSQVRSPALLPQARGLMARVKIKQGEYDSALSIAEEALPGSEGVARGTLLESIGVACAYQNVGERARHCLDEALESLGETSPAGDRLRVLSYRAIEASRAGDAPRAEADYRAALSIATEHDLSDRIASTAMNLGVSQHQRGQWGQALLAYERGWRMALALDQGSTLCILQFNLAKLHLDIGALERARPFLDASEKSAEPLNWSFMLAAIESVRGELSILEADGEQALEHLQRALTTFEELGAEREVWEVELSRLEAWQLMGKGALCARWLERSDPEREDGPDSDNQTGEANNGEVPAGKLPQDLQLRWSIARARAFLEQGQPAAARQLLESRQEEAQDQGLPQWTALLHQALSESWAALGAQSKASRHRDLATEAWEEIGITLDEPSRRLFWKHADRLRLNRAAPEQAQIARPESEGDRQSRPELGRPEPIRPELGRTATSHPEHKPATASGARESQLRTLLSISSALSRSLDVPEVLRAALDGAIDLTSAERGYLVLKNDKGGFSVLTARNLGRSSIGGPDMKFSEGIVERVLESGQMLLTLDAQSDARFAQNHSVHAMKLRSVMALPIPSPEGTVGALYLDSRLERRGFAGAEEDLLTALADQIGIALRNANLVDELKKKTRQLEKERKRIRAESADKSVRIDALKQEVELRQEALEHRYDYGMLSSKSASMNRVLSTLDRIIDTPFPLLIEGESGTGKELVARAVHFQSKRKKKAFVALNCGAVPENLFESELFGHMKGAFTGADRDREGLFVKAHGGTLFLDEIGEMPLSMQAKVLRALQEKVVRPIGGLEDVAVDFRLVSATNRHLSDEVNEGRFRQDLYYRIGVVEVELPALRDRPEDLPQICRNLISDISESTGLQASELRPMAMAKLMEQRWPGNIRELQNVLTRALLLCEGASIEAIHLQLDKSMPTRRARSRKALAVEEAARMLDALSSTGFKASAAAKLLGMSRATFYRRIKRYGIDLSTGSMGETEA